VVSARRWNEQASPEGRLPGALTVVAVELDYAGDRVMVTVRAEDGRVRRLNARWLDPWYDALAQARIRELLRELAAEDASRAVAKALSAGQGWSDKVLVVKGMWNSLEKPWP